MFFLLLGSLQYLKDRILTMEIICLVLNWLDFGFLKSCTHQKINALRSMLLSWSLGSIGQLKIAF
ncbi:hypothetical protein RchiOBHm_Chr1g0317451 [Rosa chinensis]|uniref:Uncharacterized protein n=1 Tax=Rosa chinensis TaxID=74649 RepID=A0A2P6S7W8_ROSCH|nr:hypothetical protein RchiOBHm_Chr1g0317451 [Rosa chinensis]